MSARPPQRAGRRLAVALGLTALAALAGTGPAGAQDAEATADGARLDAAAGWRDLLEAHRAPQRPRPGDTETLIVVLDGPPAGAVAPADRAEALEAIAARQDEVAGVLADLGATVTGRTAVVANTVTVTLPAGGVEAVARVAGVAAVVPVGYLAPAQAGTAPAEPAPAAAPGGSTPVGRPSARAVRIAVLDAGVDPSHPALGGGMGPTFPILGGLDLVDGDGDPRVPADALLTEAHGTQVVGVLLGAPALEGLSPAERPRVIVHRVVEAEPVGGRLRPLARTDRVLTALERSVDPDGDGDPRDRVDVVLIALSAGFTGAGRDPLADAIGVADSLGVSVVAAAGNDGPTLTLPGAIGGPGAAPAALTVGALAARPSGRLVDLTAALGPAAARLADLPLVGGPVPGGEFPAVLLDGPGGLLTGADDADFRDEAGASRVAGAVVVVARGGENLTVLAHRAAAAGARALVVWDREGGHFAISAGDGDLPIPVVGIGAGQGEGLAELVRTRSDLRVTLAEAGGRTASAPSVAAFSSTGPTAAGLQKPEVIAPGVALAAPLPGRGADGLPRTGTLSGTSASAARVAATVARLRTERPGLAPAGVRSLIVQGADPLPGVPVAEQGAGVVRTVGAPSVAVEPAVVHARPIFDGRARRVVFVMRNLGGSPLPVRLALRAPGGGERALRLAARIPAGGARRIEAILPAAVRGTLLVRHARDGDLVGSAPLVPLRVAPVRQNALGRPEVRRAGDRAEVLVRVGRLTRVGDRLMSRVLSDVRVVLLPQGGGGPVVVLGTRQPAAWPAGTYRVLLSARGADGAEVPRGRYRVRVRATAPDGTVLRRTGPVVALG